MRITNAIITAYCLCHACCGSSWTENASGSKPVAGVSIAAPRWVPFGTIVDIHLASGVYRRKVDDRTARRWDGRWDVLVGSHRHAKHWGVKHGTVVVHLGRPGLVDQARMRERTDGATDLPLKRLAGTTPTQP